MDDDTLWSLDALITLARHELPDVRAWALDHLARFPSPRAVDVAIENISHGEATVQFSALLLVRGLKDTVPFERFREPLRAVALGDGDTTRRGAAAVSLIRAGDDEAVTILTTLLRGGSRSMESIWETLARDVPAQCLAVLRALDVLDGATLSRARVAAFARVAPVETLHEVLATATRMPEDDAAGVLVALLTRAGAEHLFSEDDNVERGYGAVLDRWQARWSPVAPKARTWLATTAFREVLQAARHNQVRKVLAGCRAWDARVAAHHAEGEAAKALLAALDGLRNPTLLHARAAIALAIAASERALAHEVPMERCAPETQVVLACAGAARLSPERLTAVVARYEDEAAREPITRALAAVFEGNEDVAIERAFALATRLPGYVLPVTALRSRADESDALANARVRALTAMPHALRALAPAVLPNAQHGGVLEALGKQNQRWASDLLLQHFDALIASADDEALLGALSDLGDARALDALVAAWRPGELSLAREIVDLARLNDRLDTLPEALREEGMRKDDQMTVLRRAMSKDRIRDALAAVADKPLVLGLRCKRCGRTWHQEVGLVTIHPSRELCAREGWDGICFERIAVCKYCGAEDDYELPSFASMALLSQTLASVLRGTRGDGPVEVRAPVLADGTRIRRPSDALRHWQAKIDKNPRDSEAWLRLAINLKKQQRYDKAVEAFQRAVALRPGRIDAPAMFIDLLTDLGRTKELPPYAEQVLVALPKDRHEPADFRQDAAATALKALRDSGEPHGLSVRWTAVGAGDEGEGTVDLARVTAHDTLAAMLAHNRVTAIALKTPDERDRESALERRVEAGNGFDRKEGGYTIQSPVVRAEPRVGRNDPCPCGSGQKYKKCHGR